MFYDSFSCSWCLLYPLKISLWIRHQPVHFYFRNGFLQICESIITTHSVKYIPPIIKQYEDWSLFSNNPKELIMKNFQTLRDKLLRRINFCFLSEWEICRHESKWIVKIVCLLWKVCFSLGKFFSKKVWDSFFTLTTLQHFYFCPVTDNENILWVNFVTSYIYIYILCAFLFQNKKLKKL